MAKKELPAHYFDLYKLTVEMADRISARRTAANAFFITLHAALSSGLGLALGSIKGRDVESLVAIFFCFIGLIFSYTWWLLLKSYRDLNTAKFKVILAMEDKFAVSPFGDEWDYLKKDPVKKWRKRYAELGSIEKVIPNIIAAVYFSVMVILIVNELH